MRVCGDVDRAISGILPESTRMKTLGKNFSAIGSDNLAGGWAGVDVGRVWKVATLQNTCLTSVIVPRAPVPRLCVGCLYTTWL